MIDVGGVGYEVWISLSTYSALPDEGKTLSLRIHTHVRAESLALFGFHTDVERGLFELLIRVNGVGPKLAQAVLSGVEPAALVGAIRAEDLAMLRSVPGVGVKTAQRILVDLRDQVDDLGSAQAAAAIPPPEDAEAQRIEAVVSALVNLGTARPRAERAALDAARESPESDSIETLIRGALRRLAR